MKKGITLILALAFPIILCYIYRNLIETRGII